MRPTFIGPLQIAVLSVLWRDGPATVREVYAAISPTHPIAYTTILSTMQRLAERGILSFAGQCANADLYIAHLSREEVIRMAIEHALAEVQATPAEGQAALDALAEAPEVDLVEPCRCRGPGPRR